MQTLTSESHELALKKREKIQRLEESMLAMPQAYLEVKHHFAHGLYAREMIMPKDCALTGKIHKQEHLCVLSKGHVRVVTEDGEEEYTAPTIIVSRVGTKRAMYAFEDSIWTTFHATKETDIDKIEAELVTMNFEELK